MQEFRGQTVLTFDNNGPGTLVVERLNELEASIQRWLEKNMQYIQFVVPIEDALTTDPVQAMFCGRSATCSVPCRSSTPAACPSPCCALNIPDATSPSSMCSTLPVLKDTRSSAGPITAVYPRSGHGHR